MQKIPTLFVRDPDDRAHVLPEVTPGCEWVLNGEGTATRKWDGTCVKLDTEGQWWARREVKPGKTPPANFQPEQTDEVTGKTVGWEPMEQSSFVKFHTEAVANGGATQPGTYELLGPRINGNPDGFEAHLLMPHGWAPFSDRLDMETAPRDYEGLRAWLLERPRYEGIVWHRTLGTAGTEMVKLKRRDFKAAS